MKMRTESDSMGQMEVPINALYGASTQRAVLNFPISGIPMDRALIRAYGLIKLAAAEVNSELGLLSDEKREFITLAAKEIYDGQHYEQFPVDVYQTGSGTSTNMNVNEVIANRSNQISANTTKDGKNNLCVHPNDDVNQSQSSNDTFPTAIHIAISLKIKNELLHELELFHQALVQKSEAFKDVLKIGRTHLMDATPISLGQEFGGYAKQLQYAIQRSNKALDALLELPLGGTAVGTGLNCDKNFAPKAIQIISDTTELKFKEAENHFEAQSAKDGLVECHGQLSTICTSLFKIANDIRLMGSGPRCSIGEIQLPATQPGSSIMPGKVNPVMSESLTMIAARVFGNQTTVTWAGANGHLELNTYMPLMAHTILESLQLITSGLKAFRENCLLGLEADPQRCESLIEYSLSMVTSLAPKIGYDLASEIAKESIATKRTVREICIERMDALKMTAEEINTILDPAKMAGLA
ncbi:MAG: aspartate ammonia-lyase [Puniceicoccaceae bacterium MED-G31]|nr:MAG: aspartate ammonia-lyase [Puniceicoccaceae bacterium MED-G31]